MENISGLPNQNLSVNEGNEYVFLAFRKLKLFFCKVLQVYNLKF